MQSMPKAACIYLHKEKKNTVFNVYVLTNKIYHEYPHWAINN